MDFSQSVIREVVDASMKVDLTIENTSDIPFTINNIEDQGFIAIINGASVLVNSSKNNPDTDGDSLPDLLEHKLGSSPQSEDTDGDGHHRQ